MSLVDELRISRQSPATAHLKFLDNQKLGGVHAFMEGGSDPSFYRNAIVKFFPNHNLIFTYDCGGKRGVYKLKSTLQSKPEQESNNKFELTIIYFVDKDLSDIVPEASVISHDIYVTDHYSIENYVVSDYMFSSILVDCFTFTNGGLPNHARFLQIFEDQLERFYTYITPVMAWALFLKRHNTDFDFDDVNLNRLFSFSEDLEILVKETIQDEDLVSAVAAMCKVHTPEDFHIEKDTLVTELKSYRYKHFIRGKFEVWFLLKLIHSVKSLLKKLPDTEFRFSEALLSEKDIMKFLGPRVYPIPTSLEDFLKLNLTNRSTKPI